MEMRQTVEHGTGERMRGEGEEREGKGKSVGIPLFFPSLSPFSLAFPPSLFSLFPFPFFPLFSSSLPLSLPPFLSPSLSPSLPPSRFSVMMKDIHDIASKMRQMTSVHQHHQDALEHWVVETLQEYVGIIHTLPVLVKLHEEGMEIFNSSREKDSVRENVGGREEEKE